MRWLIAVGLLFTFLAGAANAQPRFYCARYNDAWAKVAGGTDLHAMERVYGSIPEICPALRAQAKDRIALVRGRPSPAVRSTEVGSIDDAAYKDAHDTDTVEAYDDYLTAYPNGRHRSEAQAARDALANPPPPEPVAGPPPAPVDPCSQEAVDARDPSLPKDGPDPAWPSRSRSGYASRYVARAEMFKEEALKCGTMPAALANYGFAAALSNDPAILKARAEIRFDMGDYNDAIADYTAAIAASGGGPPDETVLVLYANRAAAYSKLRMLPEEIADLGKVVDQMGLLNGDQRGQLLPSSVYKERLARAYYGAGDFDNAEMEYGFVEPAGLDWQDLFFIGSMAEQKQEWDKAIDSLNQAQAKLASQMSGDVLAAARAPIELALGKAYAARGGAGDARSAWDAFQAALADAPGSADATAGLAALKPPPPRPTFTEPALEAITPPDGVTGLDNLDRDTPQPFCSQKQRNDYLTQQVSHLTDGLNANMSTLALYSASLETLRSQYDASTMLTYPQKIEYLGLIDAEIKSIRDRHEQLSGWGYAVIRFFNRIKDDPKLVITCAADK